MMAQSSSYELVQQALKSSHPNQPTFLDSGTSSAHTKSDVRRRVRPLLHDWWPEIGSVALSAVAFLAIIVTLQPHDKEPLPQWPYSISVNALVSIYVVVFKAAILFMVAESLSQLKWLWYQEGRPLRHMDIYDQASRGPWGSLLLLWSVAPRNLLAGAGALVTILMVIIDPFTQQLLAYYSCPWPVADQQASVNLTAYMANLGPESIHVAANLMSVPPAWQNAINAGIFVPGQKIPATCPSGNCTFERLYNTLGWCSECTDVTDRLIITNQTFYNISFVDTGTGTVLPEAVGYNTTLPSDYSDIFVYSTATGGQTNYSAMGPLSEPDGGSIAIVLGKTPEDIFQQAFVSDNSSCANLQNSKSWRCQGYGAATCALFPCVKKINGSIETGVLNEIIVDTSPREEWGPGLEEEGTESLLQIASTLDVVCLSSEERSSLQTAGYTIAPNQKWLGYNLTWNAGDNIAPDAPFPKSLQAHGCLYSYYAPTVNSLWNEYLSGFFQGFVWGSYGAATDPTLLHGPQNLLQVFNWGNISFERTTAIFSNVSESMTILTRQTGSGNRSAPAVGVVYRDQTCLKVRWAWLSFPAVLALMAWAFFAATLLMQSGTQWLPSWKSSTLPMLLNGTVLNDAHTSNDAGGYVTGNEKTEMARIARRVRVQLGSTDKGLGLVAS